MFRPGLSQSMTKRREKVGVGDGEIDTLMQVARSILHMLKSSGVSSDITRKLEDPVSEIVRVLEATEKCEKLERSWVRAVSKAVYEASELLDVQVANYYSSLFGCSLFGSTSIIFGERKGVKVNRLCNNISQLCEQGTVVGSSNSEVQPVPLRVRPRQERNTNNADLKINVVGRDDEKEAVFKLLLDTTSDPNLPIGVVSIDGIAGLGKTTLAKLVYDDERITNHFDLKLWVHTPKDFDLKVIIRNIMKSCSSRIGDLKLGHLESLLASRIRGKLFFLVLDDVWIESHEQWLCLYNMLRVGACGSKILLTSRTQKVAEITGAKSFNLCELSYDDSLVLFKNIALFGDLEEDSPEIRHLQEDIVTECCGLPLAIISVAHICRTTWLAEWRVTLGRLMHTTSQTEVHPSVELSYMHLPSILKPCFALCFLFPIDYEINIIDLASLWMAHGFIEPNYFKDKEAEDVAEHYILHFCSHGFFMGLEMDEYGNMVTFKMHNVIYELAHHVAKDWGTAMHLSIQQRGLTSLQKESIIYEQKLQTFLCWVAPDDEDDDVGGIIGINDIVQWPSFKSLRVLDLHAFSIEMLPKSIGTLIHLRYLDLSHNGSLQKLPDSIANLHHLQTLKLEFCYELKELPNSFKKLVCLRRLELDGCESLTFMPPDFENLFSLRKLSRYLVGRPHYKSFSGLKSLGNLNYLRGRLMIELSENWTAVVNEAAKANLFGKSRLTELGIKWGATRHTEEADESTYQKLLDGLKPPHSLKWLQIEGYRGKDFPIWARGNGLATVLPRLITVYIDGCGQCKTLPLFSCLPHLKRLSLQFMHDVQFFEKSSDSSSTPASRFFPSLEELTLHSFYSLEGWWEDERQTRSVSFKRLQKLKIWSCPKLKSMPLFPKVEVLDLQNINEKLIEFHIAPTARPKHQTSMLPSSSHSEISSSKPKRHLENLQHLKALHIKGCPHLKTLTFMKKLHDLEELQIVGCEQLDLSGGCPGSCGVCEECRVPWKNLSKLCRLTLRELPKLVTLPVGLRFTKKLRNLCISTCNNFNALPECVHNLTLLQHLRLEGCPELAMLPMGLKDINSLVKIDIIECPQLMERCQEGGEDWHKIKHARVLCHKSWRYELMSDAGMLQKPKNQRGTVVVRSEDPTIHVDVTIKRI